jgi:predicted AAA+ superfamily ATPase
MALSNRDRVDRAFQQLVAGLRPYVERRMVRHHPGREQWFDQWVASAPAGLGSDAHLDDPAVLLRVMADFWTIAFRQELHTGVRNVVFSLRNRRNQWAHNKPFHFDDTYRVLDEVEQLLVAIDAPQSDTVGEEKAAFMRAKVQADLAKTDRSDTVATGPVKGLVSWREVAQPHDDVAQGRYALAEFAADLHGVSQHQGSPEYTDPVEFFRRTYLTQGLRQLLADAAQRVAGVGGAPVVDLQTTFGGGKTHSMIALYHLFSGVDPDQLPDELVALLAEVGVTEVPAVPRAVLVGTAGLKPGQPTQHPDGTEVRTMWGELAWQLGGRAAFDLVAEADRTGTAPGDALDRVFELVGPCVILIDEWVAYARQLLGDEQLPAGSFDTHFSFAQGLTESVRRNPGVLLVVSLPASAALDKQGEPVGSEAELGGVGGREALARLRNVIGRVESSWRPATAEESFEIVRRRLFKPLDPERVADRDAVVDAFADYYRRQAAELPDEVRSPDYLDRMRRAYPIHPELFARLYEDWSTLDRFQRTRGVLRLMASVISALWEAGDQSPLIMPASLPLELATVSQELLRNLEDHFKPVIDTDIDGESATSRRLDREFPNLGRYQATRRVARAVFFASAPTLRSPNRGVEAARVRLACALPGETIATYGDALNRLAERASFLYEEGSRFWFDTQQSVVRRAQEHAETLRTRELHTVHEAIVGELKERTRDRGDLAGVHVAPAGSEEVSDDDTVRLVVLGPEHPFIEQSDTCAARTVSAELLERRGSGARQRRNMVVFLAPDHRGVEVLEQATAELLAWRRIAEDAEVLNLDRAQERQANERRERAAAMLDQRLAEAYRWLLVPTQDPTPGSPVELAAFKLEGSAGLARRASDRLTKEARLYTQYPAVLLRSLLNGVLAPEWQDGHVSVGRLWEVFCQYPYLPRLRDRAVLENCVAGGSAHTTWEHEGFAIAQGHDGHRYLGLVAGQHVDAVLSDTLLVRPDVANAQLEEEQPPPTTPPEPTDPGPHPVTPGEEADQQPVRRFHGTVELDPVRSVKHFQQVLDEVLVNLQAEGELTLRVEITATSTQGFSEHTVRTVTENARTLRFEPWSSFEP